MKRKIEEKFLLELATIIENYNDKCDLFCGGCAYAAYLIADACKTLGIRYRTVMYQYQNIIQETNFTKAINGRGVAHVAIRVKYEREWKYVGSCEGIKRYFAFTCQDFTIREYRRICPDEILSGYRNNVWNTVYDRAHCNGPLTRDVRRLVVKYSEMR